MSESASAYFNANILDLGWTDFLARPKANATGLALYEALLSMITSASLQATEFHRLTPV